MKPDLSTIIGLCVACSFIFLGMLLSAGGDLGMLIALFLNQPDSAAITVGGSFGAVVCSFPFSRLSLSAKIVKSAMLSNPTHIQYQELIEEMLGYAKETRKNGILALEEKLELISDPFVKTGIQLAVDGTTKEQLEYILQSELNYMLERHNANQDVILKWAEFAPAYGMIGTLIGLVSMLANLSDPDAIGPAMAVALVTTLYGSLMANMICIPITSKLKNNTAAEEMRRKMIITGILAIQNGDNPGIVRQKLLPFLAPNERSQVTGD